MEILDTIHGVTSRGVVQCISELFHAHHMHQKLVWRFWTPFMVLRSWGRPFREIRNHSLCYGREVVQSYSTLTRCIKSSLGDLGHHSWCYGFPAYVQVHTHTHFLAHEWHVQSMKAGRRWSKFVNFFARYEYRAVCRTVPGRVSLWRERKKLQVMETTSMAESDFGSSAFACSALAAVRGLPKGR